MIENDKIILANCKLKINRTCKNNPHFYLIWPATQWNAIEVLRLSKKNEDDKDELYKFKAVLWECRPNKAVWHETIKSKLLSEIFTTAPNFAIIDALQEEFAWPGVAYELFKLIDPEEI